MSVGKGYEDRIEKEKIKKVKVLFSTELPPKEKKRRQGITEEQKGFTETRVKSGRPVPASVSFVPGVAGLMIAGEVIRDLVFGK